MIDDVTVNGVALRTHSKPTTMCTRRGHPGGGRAASAWFERYLHGGAYREQRPQPDPCVADDRGRWYELLIPSAHELARLRTSPQTIDAATGTGSGRRAHSTTAIRVRPINRDSAPAPDDIPGSE
jgi:hypothetical protein